MIFKLRKGKSAGLWSDIKSEDVSADLVNTYE